VQPSGLDVDCETSDLSQGWHHKDFRSAVSGDFFGGHCLVLSRFLLVAFDLFWDLLSGL